MAYCPECEYDLEELEDFEIVSTDVECPMCDTKLHLEYDEYIDSKDDIHGIFIWNYVD